MNKSPWSNDSFATISLEKIDDKFLSSTLAQVDYLVKKMKLTTGSRILDLGCGAGRHSIELSKRGMIVTGIDISETMLCNAQQRNEKAGVKVDYIKSDLADLYKIGLGYSSFDGVICLCESGIGVLGSESKDFEFFRQVYNLLCPDSYFVMTCFNSLRRYIRSKGANPKFDYINSTMAWSCPMESDGEMLSELQRQYAPSEIKMLLKLNGFSEIDVLNCCDGMFTDDIMGIEDIEMLVIARKV